MPSNARRYGNKLLILLTIKESVQPDEAMVSKTREKFIEVARQLFARKGVENTTMNDIASASDKGRRTIYTYFKSKREIFNAVIQSETDQLLNRLAAIVASSGTPEEKLRAFILCRFETLKEIVTRNGSLRAGFFRDVRKVDRARTRISEKEVSLLKDLLREGVKRGEFVIDDLNHMAIIIVNAAHGLDVPYIRGSFMEQGIDKTMLADYTCDLVINGIKKR